MLLSHLDAGFNVRRDGGRVERQRLRRAALFGCEGTSRRGRWVGPALLSRPGEGAAMRGEARQDKDTASRSGIAFAPAHFAEVSSRRVRPRTARPRAVGLYRA